jgi:hypothetical protein
MEFAKIYFGACRVRVKLFYVAITPAVKNPNPNLDDETLTITSKQLLAS